jgi:hypothetical protein
MRQVGILLLLVACAHNVPQDKATGPDGKQKGALPVELVENEAKVKGIVTYPGGDRVDWRKIDLPQGTRGKLDLRLTYNTPRPGLRVAFDVFDQWNTPVVAAVKKPGRMQDASIDVAKGTYYVRIYAPRRQDAGTYRLEANFTPDIPPPPPDLVVPEPPKLPAVPLACTSFDPNNEACVNVCPEVGAPPGWKACVDRDKAEKDAETQRTACEQAEKERAERIKNAPKPMDKRIIDVKINGDEATITVAVGTDGQAQLDKSWTGEVLNAHRQADDRRNDHHHPRRKDADARQGEAARRYVESKPHGTVHATCPRSVWPTRL